MVRLFLAIIALLLPGSAFAAKLVANIDTPNLTVGDPFTLSIQLEDAQSRGTPDITSLLNAFDIQSQSTSTNVSFINGQASTVTSWDFVLVPLKEGNFTLPAFTMGSSAGTLSSAPIPVKVGKGTGTRPQESRGGEISFTSDISATSAYVNQPLIVSYRILSKDLPINTQITPPRIGDNALIEPLGKEQEGEVLTDTGPLNEIIVRYLVTPVRPGELTIPPALLRGEVPVSSRKALTHRNPFGMNTDPFAIFDRLTAGGMITTYRPFSLETKPINITISAPEKGVLPWLPVSKLTLSETFDVPTSVNEGEPLSRIITLVAEGAKGETLPALPRDGGTDARIYAEKPEIGTEIANDGHITGWRSEHFTVVPQNGGSITLPPISVRWWNVNTHKLETATLPARTLNVKGIKRESTATPAPAVATPEPKATDLPANGMLGGIKTLLAKINLLPVLALGILLALVAALATRRKTSEVLPTHTKPVAAKPVPAPQLLPIKHQARKLEGATTPEQLQAYLQELAQHQLGLSRTCSTPQIASALSRKHGGFTAEEAAVLLAEIDRALYARQTLDVTGWKQRFTSLLNRSRRLADATEEPPSLMQLNPHD